MEKQNPIQLVIDNKEDYKQVLDFKTLVPDYDKDKQKLPINISLIRLRTDKDVSVNSVVQNIIIASKNPPDYAICNVGNYFSANPYPSNIVDLDFSFEINENTEIILLFSKHESVQVTLFPALKINLNHNDDALRQYAAQQINTAPTQPKNQ